MIKVNIFEIKARFSEYVDRASKGDVVVIYRHNKPVAELRAVQEAQSTPRPIGPIPGRPGFKVPPSFFDPLPEEELRLWEGAGAPVPLPNPGRSRRGKTKAR